MTCGLHKEGCATVNFLSFKKHFSHNDNFQSVHMSSFQRNQYNYSKTTYKNTNYKKGLAMCLTKKHMGHLSKTILQKYHKTNIDKLQLISRCKHKKQITNK